MIEMCRCGAQMTLRDTESSDRVAVVRYGCMNGHDRHETVALAYSERPIHWRRNTQQALAARKKPAHYKPRQCMLCKRMIERPMAVNQRLHQPGCVKRWENLQRQNPDVRKRTNERKQRKAAKQMVRGMLWTL